MNKIIPKMEVNEFMLLARAGGGLAGSEFYTAADRALAKGFIDELGILTAKGRIAIKRFEDNR